MALTKIELPLLQILLTEVFKYLLPTEINMFKRSSKQFNTLNPIEQLVWLHKIQQYYPHAIKPQHIKPYDFFWQQFFSEFPFKRNKIFYMLSKENTMDYKHLTYATINANYQQLTYLSNNQPILNYIFTEIIQPEHNDESKLPLFHWAIICNQPIADLSKYPNQFTANQEGKRAMHMAVEFGYLPIVQYLISKHHLISTQDKKGNTPMHLCQNAQIANVLLQKRPRLVDMVNTQGENPLHVATEQGNFDVCQELLNVQAIDINRYIDKSGLRPIHLACASGNVELVKLLLDKGAAIDVLANYAFKKFQWENISPLFIAVMHNNIELTRLLLKRGANQELVGDDHFFSILGTTPLQYAIDKKYTTIIHLLNENRLDKLINDKPFFWNNKEKINTARAIKAEMQGTLFTENAYKKQFSFFNDLENIYNVFLNYSKIEQALEQSDVLPNNYAWK